MNKNYGCGYCGNRDTLNNICKLGNAIICEPSGLNIDNNECRDYEQDNRPDYFCAIDDTDLDDKLATTCRHYKSIDTSDSIDCATCEYFRDTLTPDTIISLVKKCNSIKLYPDEPNL